MGDDWLKVMNAQTEAVIEKNDNPPLKAKVKTINSNGTIDVSVDLPEQEIPWEIPDIPLTNNLKISKGDMVTVKFLENNPTSPVVDGMFNPKSYSGDGEDGRSILSVDKVESDGLVDVYRITYSKEPLYSYFQVKNGEDGLSVLTSEAITDLNNAIETGFYNCYSADNAPTSGFYTIEANTDGNNVIQTATNANGDMYTRIGYDVQNNPSWSDWEKSSVDTATEILNKLKTVDGLGSGLNADLLDGLESTDFIKTSEADKITVETYTNGVRFKKDGNYIFSACWGLVNLTTTGSNGRASTTVNFPFTFQDIGGTQTSIISQSPLSHNCGNGNNQFSTADIYLHRTEAGTNGVRWYVYGR